jgi:epoxyqueuosine reductase
LKLSNREFKERFGPTAAGWRGKKTLQRNALIALGNAGREEALPALGEALDDPRPEIRAHAAWALGQIGGDRAREYLEERLREEGDEAVRGEIEGALLGCTSSVSTGGGGPSAAGTRGHLQKWIL